ncbi:MAG TPA: thermonuclease family protein [Acidimicrobiia bacterium]|nr:thermonuclease family protein [Acidimicrobiia bacterium]
MARSRVVVVTALVTALAGSAASGWWVGGHAAATTSAVVVDVVDGDTIVVELPNHAHDTVRLLGVDTPETVHPERGVECFGPEASAFTKRHLLGRRVVLERDVEPRDRYDRRLARVLVDGDAFNARLLREGYARFLVVPPNLAHAREMLALELAARRAGRGLWGACTR